MATFLFLCPNTGYRVQGWVAAGSEDKDVASLGTGLAAALE
jgi:hypothetical protein